MLAKYLRVLKMSKVLITDYIANPDVEKEVLGDYLCAAANDQVEVILVWHQKVDKEYIDRFPNLKGIVRYGVGYDNIDINYATSKGVVFCNTPDYGTDEVSDTAMAMILNIVRGVTRYDFMCREYTDTWQENTLAELKRSDELILGIIGAGRIGGSVAIKSKAFGIKVIIYDPYKDRGYEKMLGINRVDELDELLDASDIVSFHAPLTSETKGIVNERFVSKMKKHSSFINTARGQVISDIDIFYDPLINNQLNCIALDVLPYEPPKNSKLIQAWRNRDKVLDGRVIINPHTAYFSGKAFWEMRFKAASNVKRILDGKTPFNVISNT
jgi:D-3-phosphoglycerate dehydrogenase